MNLRRAIYNLGGKLIKPLIRLEPSPITAEQLGLDADTPVIYVLEKRGWTDLYVLSMQCDQLELPLPLRRIQHEKFRRWHSVYAVAPNQPIKAWFQNTPKRSPMLQGLLEVLAENPDTDIQFVPVTILWGRPVSKQRSWLHILFADSWALAGRVRKAFTILFNGRNTLVNYGKVVRFREMFHEGSSPDVDSLHDALNQRIFTLKTTMLGPDISHRRTMVRKLLATSGLRDTIRRHAIEKDISEYKATLIARRYLYEIVADATSITIALLQRGLKRFWNRFYSGIETHGELDLGSLSSTHTLVYVPCHRSHIDYLLLSYVIHTKALALPYIAAGKNLDMPVIGTILKGGGAFFIRRSFKGNRLYASALFEYVARLHSMGMPVEYFIEGGRSRTGRLLKGKPGMLAITTRAYLKYRARPIAFVPVYIAYEKMLEGKSYLKELSGKKKRGETLFGSIRSMLRIRGEFGRVHACFGEAIFLEDVLDKVSSDWRETAYDDDHRPGWLRNCVDELSTTILTRINECTYVNSINLVASVLLTQPNNRLDEVELITLVEMCKTCIDELDYSSNVSVTTRDGEAMIRHCEQLGLLQRKQHQLGDIIAADEKTSMLLPYYRNNILHLLALPCLIACCFNNMRTISRDRIQHMAELAYPFLKDAYTMRWEESSISGYIDTILSSMTRCGLLICNEALEVYTRPGSGSREFLQLEAFSRIISPVLELYYLTAGVIFMHDGLKVDRDTIIDTAHLIAQRTAMMHDFEQVDYADRKLVEDFVRCLEDQGHLNLDDTIDLSNELRSADKLVRGLISSHMRSRIIQQIRRHSKVLD